MSPPNSHFPDINILGADFCNEYDVRVWHEHKNQTAKLYFGGDQWELNKKLEL
jgi:hypothetical protein